MTKFTASLYLALSFILTCSLSAQAQDSSTTTAQENEASGDSSKEYERLEVTGSRIKRIDVETTKNIISIDRDAINKSGVGTVGDLLQNMTISSFGSEAVPLVNNNTGSYINVRGIGDDKTLVLLDGRRLPISGDNRFDVSKIPVAAIERIDILPDSASAIYGADAIGGVVNIITRKNYDGLSMAIRHDKTAYTGQDSTTYSLVTGSSTEKSEFMFFLGYRSMEPFYYLDSPWAYDGTSLSVYSWPANYVDPNGDLKSPGAGVCSNYTNTVVKNGVCRYDYGKTMQLGPNSKDLSMMTNYKRDLSDFVTFFGHARASQRRLIYNMAPNAFNFTLPHTTDDSVYTNIGLAQNPGGDIEIYLRGVPWGNREWEDTTEEFGSTVGLNGIVGEWDWELSLSQASERTHSLYTGGFFLKSALVDNINSKKFNPFDPSASADLSFVASSKANPWQEAASDTEMVSLMSSGELGVLPGGPISVGFGVDWQRWRYQERTSSQAKAANISAFSTKAEDTFGTRNLTAFWAETFLPILPKTELRLAVRHDGFSDFSSATSPLAQITYKPMSSLMWKLHVGQGFAAPSMKDKYGGQIQSDLDVYDTKVCREKYGNDRSTAADCQYTEMIVLTKSNTDLKAERSFNWSTGIVASPIEGLDITTTYWFLKQEDLISADPQVIMDGIAENRTFDGVVIDRHPNQKLKQITIPKQNVGIREDAGIDLGVNYRFRYSGFNFGVKGAYSHRDRYRIKFLNNWENYLGINKNPRYRANLTLSGQYGNHSLNINRNEIGPHLRKDRQGDVLKWVYFNVMYQWNTPIDSRLGVGVRNLFNNIFPLDKTPSNRGDAQRTAELYPPFGQVLFVDYTQNF